MLRPSNLMAATAAVVVLAMAMTPAMASGAQVERACPESAEPTAPVTCRDQREPSLDPTGLMVVSPARVEQDVVGGQRSQFTLSIFNDDAEPLDVSVDVTDVGPASNPKSLVSKTQDGEFGAGEWLTPDIQHERLQPFEELVFVVVVDPPFDAPVGTNLGGITVVGAPAQGPVGADDGGGFVKLEVLAQVFLTIAGPVKRDLRVTDVAVRDTLVLGSQRFVVWEITYQNNGTVNEHVNGSVAIKSIFGNTAHRQDVEKLIVLRGAKRTSRVIWRDLPWVGAFAPEVRVHGDDAKRIEVEGERVVVLPVWLPLLLGAVIVGPALFLWWRRRQEWRQYLDEETYDEEWDDPDLVGGH